jgi:hypothetical protein
VQADGCFDGASDPLDHQWHALGCRPLGLDRDEPGSRRTAPAGQGAGALPAVAGRGGTAVGGGVRDGRGLGHARVARHDDWHPPRRGLRSALRDIDRDGETIEIRRNYVLHRGVGVEKDTKTHQMRRIALDSETVALLREQKARVAARAADLGSEFAGELYMFGGLKSPDHRTPYSPRAVSSRYRDMAERLGIRTHIHALRHYSATELLTAGVDLRTVAGRLGHGGGGSTTLRVYAAWVASSDRMAAELLRTRLPGRPKAPKSDPLS